MKKLLSHNSLLVKIFTMFLCVIIPAYGTIALSYGRMNQILRGNILESMQLQTVHYLESLEHGLTQISQLQQEYINDMDLQVFGIANQLFTARERQQIISKLQARLARIKDSRQYMMETGVYIFSMGLDIQAGGLQSSTTPFQLGDLRSLDRLSHPRILKRNDEFYLITIYPDYAVNTQPTFLVYTQISLRDIWQFMAHLNLYEGAIAILFNEQNQIMGANMPVDTIRNMDLMPDPAHIDRLDQDARSIGTLNGNYLVSSTSDSLGLMLSVYFPERVAMQEVNLMRILNLVLLLMLSLLSGLFARMIYRNVHKPLATLEQAFMQVGAGDANVRITHQSQDEFSVIYDRFNHMVQQLHELIARVYQQEIESKRSELKQLQSQINPHFLYNSFFIIYRLAKMGDTQTLSEFSHHMGEYFRYVTRNHSDEVTLRDEIKHAVDYIHIQDIRFSNRIDVSFPSLDPKYEAMLVPRLILQPILENCYEHGFSGEVAHGVINIAFTEQDGLLLIRIENSGDSIEQQKCDYLMQCMREERLDTECTGIINVSRRLKLCFRRDGLLRIEPLGSEGVAVTLSIPIEGGVAA